MSEEESEQIVNKMEIGNGCRGQDVETEMFRTERRLFLEG
jgi:hypothetical protein